jgi:hypothetical protein
MGSDDHTTFMPSRFTARSSGGSLSRVEDIDQLQQIFGIERGAAFQADRIFDAAHELDMGAVGLAGAVADPQHMGRGVVPVAAGGIDARHRLLIRQQQRFVAGVEIGATQLGHGIRGDAAGRHEIQRFGNTLCETFVFFAGRRVRYEAQHPTMHIVQVGISALGKGAQQIERRRRLGRGLQQALRIGNARRGRELAAINVITAIGRQGDVALLLEIVGTRLGELAGDAAHLHHRHARGKGQHHRHLQQHAEGVANIVGMEFGEALGAVPALQQESLAFRHLAEPGHQIARLAGENQRRVGLQLAQNAVQRRLVRIIRHLARGLVLPALRGPALGHRLLHQKQAGDIGDGGGFYQPWAPPSHRRRMPENAAFPGY